MDGGGVLRDGPHVLGDRLRVLELDEGVALELDGLLGNGRGLQVRALPQVLVDLLVVLPVLELAQDRLVLGLHEGLHDLAVGLRVVDHLLGVDDDAVVEEVRVEVRVGDPRVLGLYVKQPPAVADVMVVAQDRRAKFGHGLFCILAHCLYFHGLAGRTLPCSGLSSRTERTIVSSPRDLDRRYLTLVSGWLVSLPHDLKVLFEAKDEPTLDRVARELAAGAILYVLTKDTSGEADFVGFADDAILLREALRQVGKQG